MGTSSRPLSRAASDTRSRAMVQLGQPSKSRIANAADPAYTATDLNGHRGHRTVEQAATAPVRLATLDDEGPTGQFEDEDGPVPW